VGKFSALPGEISKTSWEKKQVLSLRDDETVLEKSAEVIVFRKNRKKDGT
jgi:hypothetical protein